MKMFNTIVIVGIAALLLSNGGFIGSRINLMVHQNVFINSLIKYQLYALIIGILTMSLVLVLNPESKQLLRIGDLSVIAQKDSIIGVNGKSSWLSNGFQLLLFISLATSVFMFFGLKQSNSLINFQWWFLPYVLIFSITNSLSEELIFRFGIVAGLDNQYSNFTIQIISAVFFGLPHYFGNPGGVIGVIMSCFLGYILCKATLETRGLSIAWLIHLVQDIIIFTALFMMNSKQKDILVV